MGRLIVAVLLLLVAGWLVLHLLGWFLSGVFHLLVGVITLAVIAAVVIFIVGLVRRLVMRV